MTTEPQEESPRLRYKKSVQIVELCRQKDDDNVVEDQGIDPFYHKTTINNFQLIKICIMSLTIAPIRCLVIFLLTALANVISRIGMIGIEENELSTRPLNGWRRHLQTLVMFIVRGCFFCMGIHWINIVGQKADRSEAPILVGAPHASILDVLAIVMSNSVPICQSKVQNMLFFGTMGKFLQVLFVNRKDGSNRQDVRNKIKARACHGFEQTERQCDETASVTWRQLFLFPEGTTTNGETLITFKTGAFESGLPLQMVLIKLKDRNHQDTFTWTWNEECYSSLALTWMTLCQLYTRMEIEYLPVYYPNKLEQADIKLFSGNVQKIMARHLNLPTSNTSVNHILSKIYK